MTDILRIAPGTRTHMQAKYNAIHGKFDVTRVVQGFVNPPAFPAAWAYWPMNETTGTRADASVNARHLTPTGTPGSDVGVLGNAVTLVYPATLANEYYPDLSGSFLYSFWFKLSASPNTGSSLNIEHAIEVYVSGNGSGLFSFYGYTYPLEVETSYEITPAEKHHALIYYNAATQTMYLEIDATQKATDTGVPENANNQGMLIRSANSNECAVDEFGIWLGEGADQAYVLRAQLYNSGAGWSPY